MSKLDELVAKRQSLEREVDFLKSRGFGRFHMAELGLEESRKSKKTFKGQLEEAWIKAQSENKSYEEFRKEQASKLAYGYGGVTMDQAKKVVDRFMKELEKEYEGGN